MTLSKRRATQKRQDTNTTFYVDKTHMMTIPDLESIKIMTVIKVLGRMFSLTIISFEICILKQIVFMLRYILCQIWHS